MENQKCLCCNKKTNNSTNRLIRDSCGHFKCRSCLLNDDIICSICKKCNNNNKKHVKENELEEYEDKDDGSTTITISSKSDDNSFSSTDQVLKIDDTYETIPSNRPITHECERCDKKFKDVEALNNHSECGENLSHICHVCDKRFPKSSLLKHHLNTHTGRKPFSCTECDAGFYEKSKLNRHLLIHGGRKDFACKNCDAKFNNNASLKKHSLIHEGIKPFSCETCHQAFRDSSNLRKHVLKHRGVKYSCTICDKKYKLRWSLVVHMKSHGDKKPWACDKCDSQFYTKKERDRHTVVHSNLKLFGCKKCTLSFKRKDNLERHIKNTHLDTDPDIFFTHNPPSHNNSDMNIKNIPLNLKTTSDSSVILKNPQSIKSTSNEKSVMETLLKSNDSSKYKPDQIKINDDPNDPNISKIIEENKKRQSVIFTNRPSTSEIHDEVPSKDNTFSEHPHLKFQMSPISEPINASTESKSLHSKATKQTLDVSEMYRQMFPSRSKPVKIISPPKETTTIPTTSNDSSEYVHKKVNYNMMKTMNSQNTVLDLTKKNLKTMKDIKNSAETIELYRKILLPTYRAGLDLSLATVGQYSSINDRNYKDEWNKFKKRYCLPTNVSVQVPPLAPLSSDGKADSDSDGPVLNDINERLAIPKQPSVPETKSNKKETLTKKKDQGQSSDIHWRRRMANQADLNKRN